MEEVDFMKAVNAGVSVRSFFDGMEEGHTPTKMFLRPDQLSLTENFCLFTVQQICRKCSKSKKTFHVL